MLVHAREEAWPLSGFVHDLIVPFDPHGDDVGADVRLEDQAGDAPFKVSHHLLRMLVDSTFREDVDPGVPSVPVGGRSGECVDAVGGVGIGVVRGGKWVANVGRRDGRVDWRGECWG